MYHNQTSNPGGFIPIGWVKKMKTYQIVGRTNPYIAQRDGEFNGKCKIIISSDTSLQEAKKELLRMFNNTYETCMPNWGVVMNSNIGRNYCTHNNDGTYGYEYDSRYYSIEEAEE